MVSKDQPLNECEMIHAEYKRTEQNQKPKTFFN